MARIRISLDDLMNALEDHCYYTHFYLDRETGEIIIQSEHDLSEAEEMEGALDSPFPSYDEDERYIPIEPMESRLGFDIMERFVESCGGEARDRLLRALSKRKPFRHFKDALYDFPELGGKWWAFHNEAMKAIAEEWLRFNNIDFELTAHGPSNHE